MSKTKRKMDDDWLVITGVDAKQADRIKSALLRSMLDDTEQDEGPECPQTGPQDDPKANWPSLERAYGLFQAGALTMSEAVRYAGADCECAGASPCMNSDHAAWRQQMMGVN